MSLKYIFEFVYCKYNGNRGSNTTSAESRIKTYNIISFLMCCYFILFCIFFVCCIRCYSVFAVCAVQCSFHLIQLISLFHSLFASCSFIIAAFLMLVPKVLNSWPGKKRRNKHKKLLTNRFNDVNNFLLLVVCVCVFFSFYFLPSAFTSTSFSFIFINFM